MNECRDNLVKMEEGSSNNGSNVVAGVKRKLSPVAVVVRKRVHFADQLEQVYELPTLEEVEQDDGIAAAATTSEQATSSSTVQQQRTREMTVLSSLHGRARRELREIDIFDLQSAVKYGIKSPGHPCPRTGQPRWKFVFGNIVFITDSTCTREVTSYKQPIEIQEANITSQMRARHEQEKITLQQDPRLCATHSIVIIDQSGSMKKADVKGFRNRSQAAYGVLALEYVAEQLHQRGEDDADSGGGILDAVSVIEMNDYGTLVYDREPLDWILFNKLLHRQVSAKPRSHGNYCNALATARDLIDREMKDFNNNSEEEDVDDIDDLPSYALIFLSDGKPSDKESYQIDMQISLLNEMANKLQKNFAFHAIGLGQSTADFFALQQLAAIVQSRGCVGTFAHSSLNSVELSEAFGSVATSVTATRLEKTSTDGGGSAAARGAVDKDVTIRSKYVPTSERKFVRHTNEVSRWRYDHQKYIDGEDWPWTKIHLKNKATVGFDIEKDPFGKGAERLAFMFHEINHRSKRLGKAMVAKETLKIDDEERKIQFHEVFCRVQKQANEFAKEFNQAVKRAPQLRPVDSSLKTPDIRFLCCTVYEYRANDGTLCGLLVEDFLKGKFTKYNNNNGYVKKTTARDRTLELEVVEVYMSDFLQAFSHWVYVQTDHKLLVCDLQGVLQEEGRYPRFELTDPCIVCKGKKGRKMYGKTNTGYRGLRAFRKCHKCNDVCKGLGLPPFGMRHSQPTMHS